MGKAITFYHRAKLLLAYINSISMWNVLAIHYFNICIIRWILKYINKKQKS